MRMLFQDYEGSILELNGRECETLLHTQVTNDRDKSVSPGVFWLKIRDGKWHRFFIDTEFYFLSWTEYDKLNKSELTDEEDYPVLDIGKQFDLCARQILEVKMSQVKNGTLEKGCLEIQFSEGRNLKLNCDESGSKLIIC